MFCWPYSTKAKISGCLLHTHWACCWLTHQLASLQFLSYSRLPLLLLNVHVLLTPQGGPQQETHVRTACWCSFCMGVMGKLEYVAISRCNVSLGHANQSRTQTVTCWLAC